MRPPKPSPFFQPMILARPQRGFSRTTRQALAWLAMMALTAIAVAGTIYLAAPRMAGEARGARGVQAEPPVRTRTMVQEPGTVDLEVEKGRTVQRYRFRKVGEEMVIQQVESREQKPWWQRW